MASGNSEPGLLIGRAGPDDAATLAHLGAKTFADTFGHLYRADDLRAFVADNHSVARNAALLADPLNAAWLARQDGRAVGYAVAGPCDLPVPNRPDSAGELARLYLLREVQGRGLGGRMLAGALDWLTERFAHIYVSVYAENYGAQRLYARHGFVKIHDYHYMVGTHADPEWIMERKAGISRPSD